MTDKNNIEEQDQFISQIKNKLENHTIPVDHKVWERIEKQIGKKKRIAPLWYVMAGGIAASLAFLLLINPFTATKQNLSQDIKQTRNTIVIENPTQNRIQKNKQYTKKLLNNQVKKESYKYKTIAQNINTAQKRKKNFALTATEQDTKKEKTNTNNDPIKSTSDIICKKDFSANEVTPGNANSDLQHKNPAKKNEPKITSLQENPITTKDDFFHKKKKNALSDLTLAANLGTNGGTQLGSISRGDITYGDITYGNSTAPSSTMDINGMTYMSKVGQEIYNGFIDTEDFTKKRHSPPLTLSVLVQKKVLNRLSVSTGISYTYLHSTYSLKKMSGEVNLSTNSHYVGIPLNINITFADSKKLNYYFSAGGTIEKGIAFNREQTTIINGSESTLSDKSSINGIQASVNGAIGINYKLNKNWDIYLAPRAIYYFDNGQPTSARTESPFNLGINGGVKYNL